jgi:hypothetical protein
MIEIGINIMIYNPLIFVVVRLYKRVCQTFLGVSSGTSSFLDRRRVLPRSPSSPMTAAGALVFGHSLTSVWSAPIVPSPRHSAHVFQSAFNILHPDVHVLALN